MKEKEEIEGKEKKEKEEREKSYREEKGALAQILSNIVQKQNDTNQTVPHSIISSGTSAINISTLTSNSSQQMIVSPGPTTYAPHRHHNHDRLITHTSAEKKVTPKRQRINESGDKSEITAATTGTESQLEQPAYAPKNGDISKQHHDVQKG